MGIGNSIRGVFRLAKKLFQQLTIGAEPEAVAPDTTGHRFWVDRALERQLGGFSGPDMMAYRAYYRTLTPEARYVEEAAALRAYPFPSRGMALRTISEHGWRDLKRRGIIYDS